MWHTRIGKNGVIYGYCTEVKFEVMLGAQVTVKPVALLMCLVLDQCY